MSSNSPDKAPSRSDHEHIVWDELAAGAALHALEPDEQQLFDLHLRDCDLCRVTFADAELVAAQLGSLSSAADVHAPEWAAMGPRILAGITATPQQPDMADPAGDELAGARRRRETRLGASRRLLAVAAAVVVLAGGAVLAVRATGGSGALSTTAGMCHGVTVGCHAVELQTSSGETMADVVVRGDHATIVPENIPRAARGKTYVLWQVAADKPTAVGEFDASRTSSTSLELPYSSTLVFAVSEENNGPLPSRPSTVLASSPAS